MFTTTTQAEDTRRATAGAQTGAAIEAQGRTGYRTDEWRAAHPAAAALGSSERLAANVEEAHAWLQTGRSAWIEASPIGPCRVHFFSGAIDVCAVANAGKRGATCTRWSFSSQVHDGSAWMLNGLRQLLDAIARGEVQHNSERTVDGVRVRMWLTEVAGVRVWSPFAAAKPHKRRPARWTVAQAARLLVAGQATRAHCDYSHTDDYAYDAATNFGRGETAAAWLGRRLVEHPSGWRVTVEPETTDAELVLGIYCGHESHTVRAALPA